VAVVRAAHADDAARLGVRARQAQREVVGLHSGGGRERTGGVGAAAAAERAHAPRRARTSEPEFTQNTTDSDGGSVAHSRLL
jgi:hypothetical protein